jgi:hypothetical protein
VNFWQGDVSVVLGEDQGIAPFEGDNMLRFLATTTDGVDEGAVETTGDIYQVVDLRGMMSQIRTGNSYAFARAQFNRVLGNIATTDSQFDIRIHAFAGDPSTAAQQFESGQALASTEEAPFAALPQQWQEHSAFLELPSATDFIVVHLRAIEDTRNDEETEFDGHYVDDVFLMVM